MRDQIKAWLGSSDIKDKSALMENRRLIETVSWGVVCAADRIVGEYEGDRAG
jgi:hypothetical protein